MDTYLFHFKVNIFIMHGSIKAAVNANVVSGLIDGRTTCSNSCTRPPVFNPELLFTFNAYAINLSATL